MASSRAQTLNLVSTFFEPDLFLDLNEVLDEDQKNVLIHIIKENFSLDDLRLYLENNLDLNESQKKMLFKFWKTHGGAMMKLISEPVSNNCQGIANIDWEIHLIAHSRHQQGISKQSSTVLVNTKNQDRIMFEMSKRDVNDILEKIDNVL